MKTNRAFIIPYVNVKRGKKTIIMRTGLGARLALEMSSDVDEAYLIEGYAHLENYGSFYKRVSELVEKMTEKMTEKMIPEIRKSVENFSINCRYDVTRLILQRE